MSNNNLFFDTTNAMNYALVKAGGYTYIDDRIYSRFDPDHKIVIDTLTKLITNDQPYYNGFTELLYSSKLVPPSQEDELIYNNNTKLIPNLVQKISDEISLKFPYAIGRIYVIDENGTIVYDSHMINNNLTNARLNNINKNNLITRSYIVASNISQTRLGNIIKRSATTGNKTVYISLALGGMGFNLLNILYAVYWKPGNIPNFLK